MNDTLMERLNSEIDIKKSRNPYHKGVDSVEKTKKEFIQPFADNPGSIYSSLNDFENNITDFSNK